MPGIVRAPVVAITGSGSGIGQGCALAFARAGYRVVVNDIRPEGGRATERKVRALRGQVRFVEADISTQAGARTLVATALDAWGRLDVLVNNAGVDLSGPLDEMPERDWDRIFAVDVKGIYLCSRQAIPVMKRQKRGVILNVASVHFSATVPSRAAYAGAKSAVVGITRGMGLDLAPAGIRVVAICPGFTETEIMARYLREAPDPAGLRKAWLALQPTGRFGTPGDVGEVAVFLASDAARTITACPIVCDGGLSARLYND